MKKKLKKIGIWFYEKRSLGVSSLAFITSLTGLSSVESLVFLFGISIYSELVAIEKGITYILSANILTKKTLDDMMVR